MAPLGLTVGVVSDHSSMHQTCFVWRQSSTCATVPSFSLVQFSYAILISRLWRLADNIITSYRAHPRYISPPFPPFSRSYHELQTISIAGSTAHLRLVSPCFPITTCLSHYCESSTRPFHTFLSPFILIWPSLYRYVRLVVNLFAFCRLRPIPLPDSPRLTSKDVTVVVPSLDGDGGELWDSIRSILATEPYQIILVTIDANLLRAKLMVKSMGTPKVRVCSVAHPNKRRQMVRAIPEVETEVTVFADDDVTWPKKLLPWMLAPLEDERYGGVGTNQRLRQAEAPTFRQRLWGYLGALYLERRNFDCAACMYMDGGLPCLSGRTVAYRTKVLQDDAFIYGFTHEEWLGQYQLNADDDNFITRWLVSHGKRIAYQYHKEAEVQTTLEDNSKFLKQCLRWSRSNWRSNVTSMFRDRRIWW